MQESTSGDALWTRLDWDHPLLSVFADPRFSDFTKIRFWKHRKMDLENVPGARAVIRFDQGDPALAVIPVQSGQCLVLTSSWGLEDGQLALSSKFVPLVYRLMEWSGALVESPSQFLVGMMITLPAAVGSEVRRWITPDGKESQVGPEAKSMPLETPGIYQLAGANRTANFAVNLSPEESKVQPMPPDELERLGVPVRAVQGETKPTSGMSSEKRLLKQAVTEHEARQKGWRWILCAAMVLFLLETGMTGWISRRTAIAS